MFKIVTCGDSKYFEFLLNLEKNIYQTYGFYPIIYNLGLYEEQIKNLNSKVLNICITEKFWESNPNGHIKATHKPKCIENILNTSNDNCLYIDADTIFTSRINEEVFNNADIGITPRHIKERKPQYSKNGLINTGLIYFRNSEETKTLVEKWLIACQDHDTTDQKALSDILNEQVDLTTGAALQKYDTLNILLLDPSIYNDVACKTGIIFHFKNAGRRHVSLLKYRNFASIQSKFPKSVSAFTAFRRLIMLVKRRATKSEQRFRK
jgi:hypothetical protein